MAQMMRGGKAGRMPLLGVTTAFHGITSGVRNSNLRKK